MLTDGVHDIVYAVHDGVLGVLDGAAGAVLDCLLGVHAVVFFSVPVFAQDMGAVLWTLIAATPIVFYSLWANHRLVCNI